MKNIDEVIKEKNLRRLEVNITLQVFKGAEFVKMEFSSTENRVLLTFKSFDGRFNTLELFKCYAFNDLGGIKRKVSEVIVKEAGHLFREHCKVRGLDFRLCYQVEVYPIDYKIVVNDEVEYNTFFALCDDVVVQTSLEKEIDFLEIG
jgi:hypothetical protein